MTNDGWGKLPTSDDGWGKIVPVTNVIIQSQNAQDFVAKIDADMAKDGWTRTAPDEWSKTMPAGSTLTREDMPKWPTTQAVDWGATPSAVGGEWAGFGAAVSDEEKDYNTEREELDKFMQGSQWTPDQLAQIEKITVSREANWTTEALEGASNRVAVINSLRGVKDQYTIDQDGELSNIKETIAKPSDKETGVYIAYSNGKWLHAILSGPYDTQFEAMKWADAAYELFTEDGAFKLAFENNFDRDGVYYAEIPLSAKRHGAYGVLS